MGIRERQGTQRETERVGAYFTMITLKIISNRWNKIGDEVDAWIRE